MPVPSHAVTSEMLAAWGFPVERTDKIVGSKIIVQPGMRFHEARHAAWLAGHVTVRTLPPPEGGHKRPEFQTPAEDAAALAWADAHVRPQDRKER